MKLFLAIPLFFGLIAFSQETQDIPKYDVKSFSNEMERFPSSEKYLEHKRSYFQVVRALDIPKDPNYFYKFRIDLNKVKSFEKLGVDVVGLGKRFGKLQFTDYAITSDYIIKGTVIEKNHFTESSDYFHTRFVIRIDELIHGDNKPKEVVIYTRSGYVEDGVVELSTEIPLYLGEEGVFFLRESEIAELEELRKMGGFHQNINIINNENPYYLAYKAKETHGVLFDFEGEEVGNSNSKLLLLKEISQLKQQNNFYNINFK